MTNHPTGYLSFHHPRRGLLQRRLLVYLTLLQERLGEYASYFFTLPETLVPRLYSTSVATYLHFTRRALQVLQVFPRESDGPVAARANAKESNSHQFVLA